MPTRLMPFCLLALLLSLPLAQPLRAEDAPGDSKVHQELRAFVDGMYAKVKSTGPAAIGLFIDNDAAKARVKGHYPRSSIKMPVLVEALIPLAVRRAAAERLGGEVPTKIVVHRVHAKTPTSALVTVREVFDDWSMWVTWHLERKGDAWRVVDMDALDTGYLMSEMIAVMLSLALDAEGTPEQARLTHALKVLAEAMQLVQQDDVAGAADRVAELEGDDYPPFFLFMRAIIMASGAIAEEDHQEGKRWSDEAVRLRPDAPIGWQLRAYSAWGQEQWQSALDAVERHEALLAPDPDLDHVAAEAELGLGRVPQAHARALRAIAELPDNIEVFSILLATAGESGREALLDRHLEAFDDRADALRMAIERVILKTDDVPGWLFDALEKRSPKDWYLSWKRGALAYQEAGVEEAWPLLHAGWKGMDDPEWRAELLELFVEVGVERGAIREVWAGIREPLEDRASAFSSLAWWVMAGDNPEELQQLLTVTQGEREALPYFEIVRGRLALLKKEHAKAIEILEPVRAALVVATQASEDMDDPDDPWSRLWDAEEFLFRAALRGKKTSITERIAKEVAERDDDPSYLLLHLAAQGDVAGAEKAFQAFVEYGGDMERMFNDSDLGVVFQKAPYRAWFEKQGIGGD